MMRMCASMSSVSSVSVAVLCAVLFLPDQLKAIKLERDWKTVPLKDIDASIKLSQAGLPFYRIINKIDGSVYIGGNETLVKLSVDTDNSVKEEQRTLVTNEPPATVSCAVKNPGNEETVCWNFIRSVEKTKSGQLFVCGTNSYSGMCYSCPPDFGGNINQDCTKLRLTSTKTLYLVPESPTTNPASAIFSRVDNESVLYSASSAGEVLERYSIPDITINDTFTFELSSVTKKKKLLNRPAFVGKPFEYIDADGNKYIFIFYRETALEYSTFGDKEYSRIARVCQNDTGGVINVDKFVTYVKARLNCSIPDTLMPFYYDEIQDVVWNGEEAYAVFTSPTGGSKSSALCRFRMSDIMKLFDEGDLKDQAGGVSQNEWLPVEVRDPTPGTCNEVHTTDYPPLMDKLVPNYNPLEPSAGFQVSPPRNYKESDTPTLYVDGVRFTSLAIDMDNTVYFFGTSDGTIIKHFDGSTVEINELGTTGPITGLELLEKNSIKHLVITTETNVITWALNTECSARSQQECEIIRSPYCQWTDGACNCLTSNSFCTSKRADVLVQPTVDMITSCDNTDVYLYCAADAGPYFNGVYNLRWIKENDELFISNNSHLVEAIGLSDKLVELKVTVLMQNEGMYICNATVDNTIYTKRVKVMWKSCLTQTSLEARCGEYTALEEARKNIQPNGACSVDVDDCSQCRLGYSNENDNNMIPAS